MLLALATALVVVMLGRWRGGSLKMLELSDLIFFGGLAIVAQLFAGMTVWVIVAGVLVLVFDGGPTWFGIALIVVGVLLTHTVARAHKVQKQALAAQP